MNTQSANAARDLQSLSAVEIIGAHCADLMTAAAVKLGLYEGTEADRDLAEARILIEGLAGLINSSAPYLGGHHVAPMRDGLKTLQASFRESSSIPDLPGQGPGESVS
jgi:hypothetical protein